MWIVVDRRMGTWCMSLLLARGQKTEDKRRGDVDKEDKTGETKLDSGELDRSLQAQAQQTIAHSSTQ